MRRFLFLAAAALVFHSSDFAQTTFATIVGLVTDPNGAVVVGATVTAVKVDSNYRYTARSNGSGNYTIGQLLEGQYVLRAESPGFKTFVEQDIRLANQELRRIDIRLEVGTVETTVEVKGGAGLINTETVNISDNKTAEVIKDLPLN